MIEQQQGVQPMERIRQIHMVGIGGAGMSGIARLLLNLGFTITGSDQQESAIAAQLRAKGATVAIGHRAEQIEGADVVVVSSAIDEGNPEITAARASGVPVIPRAEMLAELMRFRYGIAVAGTHGKTTTTSLVATLLEEAGLDPTYVIGGRINRPGVAEGESGAQLGKGRYLVAEADESDASFLHLQPMVAVVTNIDEDHMSTYGGELSQLDRTFEEFIHHIPFYGCAVLCIDDPGVQRIVDRLSRPLLRYGFSEGVDFGADAVQLKDGKSHFQLCRPGRAPLPITLNLPGHHNVLNALAAIAVASYLGVEDGVLVRALGQFQGIARRFENYGWGRLPHGRVEVVDDYGHHPREVAATIETIRNSWPGRRLLLAFQPHRYSRTRDLYEDFVEVLSRVDQLLLLEVYGAGEEPISGADGRSLARSIRARGEVEPVLVHGVDELIELLPGVVQEGDLLLLSGAGSIGQAASQIIARWGEG
jgi:UDP-N-acetylmuramate--alanine ligase